MRYGSQQVQLKEALCWVRINLTESKKSPKRPKVTKNDLPRLLAKQRGFLPTTRTPRIPVTPLTTECLTETGKKCSERPWCQLVSSPNSPLSKHSLVGAGGETLGRWQSLAKRFASTAPQTPTANSVVPPLGVRTAKQAQWQSAY